MSDNELNMDGDWNVMLPVRITVPEPVYNLLKQITIRKGKSYVTDEIRECIIIGLKHTTGIDIIKHTTNE